MKRKTVENIERLVLGKYLWFCFQFNQQVLRSPALDNVFQPFSCVKISKESYYSSPSNICFRVKIGTDYQRNFPGWSPNG